MFHSSSSVAVLAELAANASLEDSFRYTVSDGADTNLGTVVITVFGFGSIAAKEKEKLGVVY